MRSRSFYYYIFTIILILLQTVFATPDLIAQENKTNTDIGLWAGFSASKKLPSHFRIKFYQEFRFNENISNLNIFLSDFGIDYKTNAGFTFGSSARYLFINKTSSDDKRNLAYNFDINYSRTLFSPIALSYRFRYQNDIVEFFTFEPENYSKATIIRNRIKLSLLHKKIHHPYTSAELFYYDNGLDKSHFNRIRIFAGDEISTSIGNFNYSIACEKKFKYSTLPLLIFTRIKYIFKC